MWITGALPSLVLAAGLASASVTPAVTPGSSGPLIRASAADILAAVKAPGAEAVLVNVWATWCVPCREEMPELLRLRRAYAARGLRLILVSGDFTSDADQAAAFLRELGVDFPTYLKEGGDMEFINALDPKWSGALPVSFIYDGAGQLRHAVYGKGSYQQFEQAIRDVLKP
jgi:thiol-disulfide isomerase/thioredoxin